MTTSETPAVGLSTRPAAVTDWQGRGLCREVDGDLFFPDAGGATKTPKQVCMACEVRVQCLEYALANNEQFGVWGGLSERERWRLRKEAA
ncbi:WhiB family transcriptional regulator [Streptomyces sp. NPDC056529]|uniref:WhiB family transcriptional regulator n=1 Tax=Streptomyces sp. NPDC056529 TaxID=3345855 RepID=UPI0036C94EA4